MNSQVGQAIREHRIVRFYDDGGTRDVGPRSHGFSKEGNDLLSGYQVRGFSRSGQLFGWKVFTLDEVRALTVKDEAFVARRAGYNPNDVKISAVHCHV